MEHKSLFLLDAYALIYRAYYALIRAPHFNAKGINTSAIFGFCNTLDEILRKESPSHIAVCFDPKGGHTFRHDLYNLYKANRDAQPEDITNSIPWIKRILEAYRIPVIQSPEFEADDVIGTLSRRAEQQGFVTYMMTPDKDSGQLVTDRVLMYRPPLGGKGFEIRGPQEVCERFGIDNPRQMIDLLALEGDSIDNIPGCPGVGEKTAQKLIAQWGSVENLLNNTDALKGALRQKVVDNADMILLSKTLATIRTDVPIDVDIDSLVRRDPKIGELLEIFGELEFRTLARRIKEQYPDKSNTSTPTPKPSAEPSLFDFDSTPAEPTEAAPAVDTVSLTDPAGITAAIGIQHQYIAVAIEATGPEAMTASIEAVTFATDALKAFRVALPPEGPLRATIVEALRPIFTSAATVISHDVKRDMLIMRRLGIDWSAPFFDSAVAHYLLQPEGRHALDIIAAALIPNYPTPDQLSAPWQASTLLSVRQPLTDKLVDAGLWNLLTRIELPHIPVLADMEWTGVRIDVTELNTLSQQLTQRLSGMEEQVYQLAGESFNISSPSQVGEILFGRLMIDPKAKRTKKGAYSTTEEILEKYAPMHPIVDLILKIRRLRKLLATYINALPALINPATSKIHTTYNQTVTATGRISSTNPNLQNIPIRTDDGREIRRAFIADPGDLFLSADYSQIELRLMADVSRDEQMVDAFLSGADFHQATAAKIYHEPLQNVTPDQRRNAKTANFGIIYGISAFGLSERLGIPRAEAKALIENYFKTYPGVRRYMDSTIADARNREYVSTVMGRKRFLPEINSRNAVVRAYAERNAINAPLQGSAADIIKRAMIDIFSEINDRHLKSKMIMQVHDELIFNVVPDELPVIQELVTRCMANAYRGVVPLEVSAGVGANWLEAH